MPRILIAPLNWGLGHATRCLPVAAALRSADPALEIHWASDGRALELLRAELPEAMIHELPHLDVRYPSRSATFNMLLAAPAMMRSWQADRIALSGLHEQYSYDAVLSDNRLGCRLPGVRSMVMTHQLHLPIDNALQRRFANAINHGLLGGFDEVVVPDFDASAKRLAGPMSAPLGRMPVRYIGPVSRFANASPVAEDTVDSPPYACVFMLSGPEPARTRFEETLLKQIQFSGLENSRCLLVRGLPDAVSTQRATAKGAGASIEQVNFLGTGALRRVLAKAERIVCRPGYTTVMDLACLRRKAVYVPTPGQPEQAWLGRSLAAQGRGICMEESELVLAKALEQLDQLAPEPQYQPTKLLEQWAATMVSQLG